MIAAVLPRRDRFLPVLLDLKLQTSRSFGIPESSSTAMLLTLCAVTIARARLMRSGQQRQKQTKKNSPVRIAVTGKHTKYVQNSG
jgi:hypothetical protein